MRGRQAQVAPKPAILAAPAPPSLRPLDAAPSRLLFDACQAGVVLRAMAVVLVPLVLASLSGVASGREALPALARLAMAVLPALLLWLLACCALKRGLDRQATSVQAAVAVLLGALCGALSFALYDVLHPLATPVGAASVWVAAVTGAVQAGVLVHWLALRQRAAQPAAALARLAELQSRIRPHFLFNTLNSAIALVRDEPARAELLLLDLSELFHHALKNPASVSSLATELQLARHYLRIEAIRFGPRLRVHWAIDEAALQASLPPLLLQPLLENAVRHGIEPSAEGGAIHILVRRRGAQVVVRIGNTDAAAGQEAARQPGHGIALQNVRARLRCLHDAEAGLRCRRRAGRYEVSLHLPARPVPPHSPAWHDRAHRP